jgi:hypothetical protein
MPASNPLPLTTTSIVVFCNPLSGAALATLTEEVPPAAFAQRGSTSAVDGDDNSLEHAAATIAIAMRVRDRDLLTRLIID